MEVRPCCISASTGTSASKFLLVDEVGPGAEHCDQRISALLPRPGWSEQDPAHWWQACLAGVPELLAGFDAKQVAGIGVGGQMHGLVALDAAGNVLRPAILWNDGRTAAQVDYLNETVGNDKLSAWNRQHLLLPALPRPSCCGCAKTSRTCLPASPKSCCPKTTWSTG